MHRVRAPVQGKAAVIGAKILIDVSIHGPMWRPTVLSVHGIAAGHISILSLRMRANVVLGLHVVVDVAISIHGSRMGADSKVF